MYVDRDIDAPDGAHQEPPAGHRRDRRRRTPWRSPSASRSWPSSGSGASSTCSAPSWPSPPASSTCSSTRCGSSAPRRSNIVIGGAAGAVPVLIGWAAVTELAGLGARSCCSPSSSSGRRRTSGPWPSGTRTTTPAADVPMLPVGGQPAHHRRAHPRLHAGAVGADAGLRAGRRHGRSSTSGSAVVLGAVFTALAVRLLHASTRRPAAPCACSPTPSRYITLLFGAMAVDELLRSAR